jgi:hypothetical protein
MGFIVHRATFAARSISLKIVCGTHMVSRIADVVANLLQYKHLFGQPRRLGRLLVGRRLRLGSSRVGRKTADATHALGRQLCDVFGTANLR